MKKIFYSLTILIGSLLFVPNVLAAEIQVCTDGCAHNSLVSAIAAANDGDEIIVSGNVIQFAGEETDDMVTITGKTLTIVGADYGNEIDMKAADNGIIVGSGGSLFIENLSISTDLDHSSSVLSIIGGSLSMQNVSMSVKGPAIEITNDTGVASQLSLTEVYIEFVGKTITDSIFGIGAYGNVKLDLIDVAIYDFYRQADTADAEFIAAIVLLEEEGFSPQLSLSTSSKADDEIYYPLYNLNNGKFGADVSNLANNTFSVMAYGENTAANINIEGTVMGSVYLGGTSKMTANYNIWQDNNHPITQDEINNSGEAIAGLSLDAAKEELITTEGSASYTIESLFAVYGPNTDEKSFLYWLCHPLESPKTAPENFVYLVGALALASILYSAYISKKAKLLN